MKKLLTKLKIRIRKDIKVVKNGNKQETGKVRKKGNKNRNGIKETEMNGKREEITRKVTGRIRTGSKERKRSKNYDILIR